MIVLGSFALNSHVQLNRKKHDIDFLMTQEELTNFFNKYKKYQVKVTGYSYLFDIEGNIVEARNPKNLDETDFHLLNKEHFKILKTEYGNAWVPCIQDLYDVKKSTALCIDEPKHHYDLKLIEDQFIVLNDTWLFKKRLEETEKRTKKSDTNMYNFFHKYHIPEYIKHDRLHTMFADLLDLNIPTYVRTIVGPTETSEELYHKLTHEQKVSLMAEESLVLAMERWFIPRNVEDGINYRLIDMFYNSNEANPTYKIFKHVNSTGLKGESSYVVDFGRKNYHEIELKWIEYKDTIKAKGGFPMWFFEEIFKLRERFKAGEKVAVV